MGLRERLSRLESRVEPAPDPEASARQERIRAVLDRVAAARLEGRELGPEDRAVVEAIRRRARGA